MREHLKAILLPPPKWGESQGEARGVGQVRIRIRPENILGVPMGRDEVDSLWGQ